MADKTSCGISLTDCSKDVDETGGRNICASVEDSTRPCDHPDVHAEDYSKCVCSFACEIGYVFQEGDIKTCAAMWKPESCGEDLTVCGELESCRYKGGTLCKGEDGWTSDWKDCTCKECGSWINENTVLPSDDKQCFESRKRKVRRAGGRQSRRRVAGLISRRA